MSYAKDDEWYHIAHTPDGVHVHRLDQEKLVDLARQLMAQGMFEDADQAIAHAAGMFAEAIRGELGFPEDWLRRHYDSTISPGVPHSQLMAIAIVHDELPEVN